VTTYASYGFTKADPAAALAAAERLAEGHGREAARGLHDDGSIDVALMEERDFHRYLIDAQGGAITPAEVRDLARVLLKLADTAERMDGAALRHLNAYLAAVEGFDRDVSP
jgi:hypothetical protein